MAELNLKQIVDKLNAEFTGDARKIVFWYDEKGEFAEDIEGIALANATVYQLEQGNQFYTKYFLEKVDTTTNYLVYAPFPKPLVSENHLEDTLAYSKRFYADRASLLSVDLGIEEKYKPMIEKHMKFFGNKERTQRFYDLEIENFNEEKILIGLMSAVCRARICSFDEVIRTLLTDDTLEDNKFIADFGKFDLLESFWKYVEQQFGYSSPAPTLEKFVISMFVTYADRQISAELPKEWKGFVSYKSGNIIAFMDNLMNHVLYRDKYDELSAYAAGVLDAGKILSAYEQETLVECDSFAEIDIILIRWIKERLLAEDLIARLENKNLCEICEMRSKMHFGRKYAKVYQMLNNAYFIISQANYEPLDGFRKMIDHYAANDWVIDCNYREFYTNYDELEDTSGLEELRELVENIYTNEYLGKMMPKWNEGLQEQGALTVIPLQRDFFRKYVRPNKERTAVIISDGMRYEVGCELFKRMKDNPKCKDSLSIKPMLSVLPSYTRLGMEALLPHKTLELTDEFKELVDGTYAVDTPTRQAVLQSYVLKSRCVKYSDMKNLRGMNLREIFTSQQVVYIYHDQIDNAGEHTEDEVFQACTKAVDEIAELIQRIAGSANTYRFIVTSDHGFIYKRNPVQQSDKISTAEEPGKLKKRRYIVAKEPVLDDGVLNIGLGYILGNEDDKMISYPCSTSVFSAKGNAGLNYVHGGSSPQEMLVPVIDIKMDKGAVETRTVQIMLVSLVQKITNLIVALDFIQSEPVSDVVKGTTYKLYFLSEDNEKISNENIYVADKREEDVQKRLFRMRFTFKNKKYDKSKKYYLSVYDENNNKEVFRHEVIMDVDCIGPDR
ncbi:BREX-1 system phosphatase PglZ type A [Petralouisia muris]|uniref:BREX-1 system phosphatase PglZ type A n=1 Tax=Petralouisia muris TaxID=3032872 RepID=A0AC61S196_9FIRM|nr:BREX-1 system phosphatase PglZ type A [Petralouisia muris]TGY98244.1 BREX-1 system phosphatase PglZ type A [Petralouisia muris]